MVEEKNDITLAELKEGLKQLTRLEVSVPTINQGLEELGLSRKKTFHDPKQELEEVAVQKQNYKILFWAILTENVVQPNEGLSNTNNY